MDIIEFLKNESGAKLTYYRQWMIWDEDDQCWKVYKGRVQKVFGERRKLIDTTDEEEAIAKLIYN